MAETEPHYWMVVGAPENFEIAKSRGWDMFGFKSTRRNEAANIRVGDKLLFYLTGIVKFGGIATVTSEMFEDHEKVFGSKKKPNEDYPFRVKVEPDLILEPGEYLDVRVLGPQMRYTQRLPAEHWRLAFQGNLHLLPREDYDHLRGLMAEARATATG